MSGSYVYSSTERLPVEVLVFQMDPEHVEAFLEVDHEVWTLGEAEIDVGGRIPFRSKEVWLDDSRPGQITIVFVWDSMDAWNAVGADEVQQRLQGQFEARFPHPVSLIAEPHEDSDRGIHRWSRFERRDDLPGLQS